MSLLRHSLWAIAGSVVLTGLRFLYTAIAAHRLSQTEFGRFAYALWLVDVTFLLMSFGAIGAMTRYYAEFRDRDELIFPFVRVCKILLWLLPALATVVTVAGSYLSQMALDPPARVILGIWTFTSGIWAMKYAALVGQQRFDLILAGNAVWGLIAILASLVLPPNLASSTALFLITAIACGAASLVGSLSLPVRASAVGTRLSRAQWRQIATYAANVWIATLLGNMLWSRGELPIVRMFTGDEGVARYSASVTIVAGAIQGTMLAAAGIPQALTRLWSEGRHVEANTLARRVTDIQLAICAVASIVLSLFGDTLLTLAFGKPYTREAITLSVMSISLIAVTLASQSHLMQLKTEGRFLRNTVVFGLGSLYIISTILTYGFGIPGSAAARAVSLVLVAIVTLFLTLRRLGRDAISTANFTVAFTIMILIAVLANSGFAENLLHRCLLLLFAIMALIVLIRMPNGEILATTSLNSVLAFCLRASKTTHGDKML